MRCRPGGTKGDLPLLVGGTLSRVGRAGGVDCAAPAVPAGDGGTRRNLGGRKSGEAEFLCAAEERRGPRRVLSAAIETESDAAKLTLPDRSRRTLI